METLTKRQREILDLIINWIQETGSPPTRKEIADKMGFSSPNASEDHLQALARKKVITLIPGVSRGIKINVKSNNGIPVVGQVAAGQPILSEEHIQCSYTFDPTLFEKKPTYFLKVVGMSMRDLGIMDGDLLAVQNTDQAFNGQIVVARIQNEVTVKTYHKDGHLVHLKAANPDFKDIVIDVTQQEFLIEGIGVGIVRNY